MTIFEMIIWAAAGAAIFMIVAGLIGYFLAWLENKL